jgi:predicted MFS family arabinose efflux permease
VFILYIPQLIISLLLVEIASSFDIAVGVAGQLVTIAAVVSAIMALLMGALSVRYPHKSLLLVGVAFSIIVALGSYIAPNFVFLLTMYSLTGISIAMVRPMSQALIGQLFSVAERPKILAYVIAVGALSFTIGTPLINILGDWRIAFLLYMLPLTLVSLIFAFIGIPSTNRETRIHTRFWQGFHVVQNKSAVVCLIANGLFVILYVGVIQFYSISFYREHFLVDQALLSLIVTGVTLVFVTSSVMGGRLVNRLGRKPLTVFGAVSSGVLVVAYLIAPTVWLSIILYFVSGVTSGIRNAAFSSLAVEQVPDHRGTMMSLVQFSYNVAAAIGSGLGGLILITFDYSFLGVLGIFAIIAAIIFHFFTIDPTTQVKQQETNNA